MKHTIAEIAAAIGADTYGDTALVVTGIAEPAMAGPNDLALATNEAYASALAQGQAQAALLWPGADPEGLGLKGAILPPRPRYAMSALTKLADPGQGYAPGVHPSAVINPTASLGEGVSVGPNSVIGPRAQIGAGCIIGPLCSIGADAQLGEGCYLRDQVSIGARVTLGARCLMQPGARIGGDGFSYVKEEASQVETTRQTLGEEVAAQSQPWARVHTLGTVVLGDDVEVGANACIDSGTIRATRIGRGTKLDNHAQVGHNCVIGEHCLICGQVGISGSVEIGNHVVLGGKVGVSDNIRIGDNVVAGGGTNIYSNVPANRAILGSPATKMEAQVEIYKSIRRLPRLLKDVTALKKAVFKSDPSD